MGAYLKKKFIKAILPAILAGSTILLSFTSFAQDDFYDENGFPTYTPINHFCDLKLPPPNPTGNPDLRLEGNGGYDPVKYDYDIGVLVEPVSGIPDTSQGEYGDKTDEETGARFSMSLGLWVDPDSGEPSRETRLNNFPYFDSNTQDIINPVTGARIPYEKALLTIGQQRTHQKNLAYGCFGSDLTQRVDPQSGRYVASTRVYMPDDFNYGTIGFFFSGYFEKNIPLSDAGSAPDFPNSRHFSPDLVPASLELVNSMSRDEVIGKVYKYLAPESQESGPYELREARVEDALVVVITARGLLDDAVHAKQLYIYFMTDMPNKAGEYTPRLMAVGSRHKCSRTGTPAAWTTKACP